MGWQEDPDDFEEEPEENDHIWPKVEGGPDDSWNRRPLRRSVNRGQKGPEMPDLDDVFDSTDPARLAAEIDKRSLQPFKHSRNRDKGFGGLPRR